MISSAVGGSPPAARRYSNVIVMVRRRFSPGSHASPSLMVSLRAKYSPLSSLSLSIVTTSSFSWSLRGLPALAVVLGCLLKANTGPPDLRTGDDAADPLPRVLGLRSSSSSSSPTIMPTPLRIWSRSSPVSSATACAVTSTNAVTSSTCPPSRLRGGGLL